MNDIALTAGKQYRPLTVAEHESLNRNANFFYNIAPFLAGVTASMHRSIKKQHKMLLSSDLDSRVESAAKKISFKRTHIQMLREVVEAIRPRTPEGAYACHACEVVGMAPLGYSKDLDVRFYKCQNCGASSIQDEYYNGFFI